MCDLDGTPTGLLLESAAIAVVESAAPPPTTEEIAERAHAALAGMAALGITTGHALEHAPEAPAVYDLIEAEHDLPVRLRCSPWVQPGTSETDWAAVAALQGTGGRRWRVRGAKLFIDGTVDNGTAWLAEPDSLGQSTAPFWPDPASYSRAIAWFDRHDVPTATHAIGDEGVRHALRALAGASGRVRHRIEHIETIPDDLVAEFATLPVTASMQPSHCTEYTAADHSDNWSTLLGPERAGRGWRIRDLRDAGVRVALGSDWPIADFDPRGILAAAQLRRRAGAPDRAPIQPEQALSARMALEGYTTHAAWSVGDEADTGSIEVGKLADLTAFAVDPLVAPPDELIDAPIMLTVVGVDLPRGRRAGCAFATRSPVTMRGISAALLSDAVSAIDHQTLAGDKGGAWAAQEGDGRGDLSCPFLCTLYGRGHGDTGTETPSRRAVDIPMPSGEPHP